MERQTKREREYNEYSNMDTILKTEQAGITIVPKIHTIKHIMV